MGDPHTTSLLAVCGQAALTLRVTIPPHRGYTLGMRTMCPLREGRKRLRVGVPAGNGGTATGGESSPHIASSSTVRDGLGRFIRARYPTTVGVYPPVTGVRLRHSRVYLPAVRGCAYPPFASVTIRQWRVGYPLLTDNASRFSRGTSPAHRG